MAADQGSDAQGAQHETEQHEDPSPSTGEDSTAAPSKAEEPSRLLRNPMAQKFQALEEEEDDDFDEFHRQAGLALEQELARAREAHEVYFFYGSLMFPRMLQHVLDLPAPPPLRPAEVVGLHLKMWGPYPALVDGAPGEVVRGMAYEVRGGGAHKDLLAQYETACYRPRLYQIQVQGQPERVLGTTFVWSGDAAELEEGAFDVEGWEKRMERILNRANTANNTK